MLLVMALFEMAGETLAPVPATDFAAEGIWERRDLQRVLRNNIDAIDDTLLVVAEEFGDFEGSGRRIDLLCVDREARLVVVELKRTSDGGHMELQALRYAAMVSAMTFDQLAEIFHRHLARTAPDNAEHARRALAEWLDEAGGEDAVLSGEVRIVLIAAGFGTEITTTVLWLNEVYNLDITCVRVVPHRVAGRLLLDVSQLIPLPEAEEFTVKLRRRDQAVRTSGDGRDWTQYVITSPDGESDPLRKRRAVLEMAVALHRAGVSGKDLAGAIPSARFLCVEGRHDGDELVEALAQKYSKFRANIARWFVDQPLHDTDTTWVLSKMWGRQTERALENLLALAPTDEFSYRSV